MNQFCLDCEINKQTKRTTNSTVQIYHVLQFFSSFPPPLPPFPPTSPPFPRARSTLLSRVIHCSLKNSQRISRLPPRFLASGGPSSCLLYRTLKILFLSLSWVGARGVAIVAAIEWNGIRRERTKERKKERREKG